MPIDEQTDLDGLTLTAPQLALLPYGLAGFFSMFVWFPLAACLPLGEYAGVIAFLGFPLFMLATVYAPTARLELTGQEIRIDAWAGWPFPRPAQLRLPLRDLELSWAKGRTRVNGREVTGLSLHSPSHDPVHLPALRVRRDERDMLTDRVEGMKVLAAARHGDGMDEIPEELRSLVQREERQRE